jgi:hypothetical protein
MRGGAVARSMEGVNETTCFCGCGRSAAFGQARAVNDAARRAAERIAQGEELLRLARTVLHDDVPAAPLVSAALEVWLSAP